MNWIVKQRGLIYVMLLMVLIIASIKAIIGLADLRQTIDLSPDPITGYDGHRAEVEFARLQHGLSLYVTGFEGIDHEEVTTRFDILWARANLFIRGQAFEAMRQQAGIGTASAALLDVLRELEDDVFTLERGDLTKLIRIEERLTPFGSILAGMTTRIADLEVEQRNVVGGALRLGVAELDTLGSMVGLIVIVVLTLFAVEAIQARRAEKELADYQGHLEDLVAKRTGELEQQTSRLELALDKERELTSLQRQFVSMVSHEFRTPLAVIDGSAQRLLRRFDQLPPDKLRATIDQIKRSVKRLLHLMESTLSASQLEAGSIAIDPQACALGNLILDVCKEQEEISKKHRIIVETDRLPASICADDKLLRQVFANLLSNAVKYSPDGRSVWVNGWEEDGDAVIMVRDEGVGIPKKELPRLFERFFRASTSTGIPGTGIGLNFVKYLIEMHNGKITVSTEEGIGSSFTVRLPIDGPSVIPKRTALSSLGDQERSPEAA